MKTDEIKPAHLFVLAFLGVAMHLGSMYLIVVATAREAPAVHVSPEVRVDQPTPHVTVSPTVTPPAVTVRPLPPRVSVTSPAVNVTLQQPRHPQAERVKEERQRTPETKPIKTAAKVEEHPDGRLLPPPKGE